MVGNRLLGGALVCALVIGCLAPVAGAATSNDARSDDGREAALEGLRNLARRPGGAPLWLADGTRGRPAALDGLTLLEAVGREDPERVPLRAAALGYEATGTPTMGYQTAGDSSSAQSGASYQQVGFGFVGLFFGDQTLTVGDLDGDGADDVITLTYDGSGITLQALRGQDGEPIWVAPQPPDSLGGFLIPVADIDGDGRTDLLQQAQSSTGFGGSGQCDDTGCTDSFQEDFVWETTLLSGATGTPMWSEAVDGYWFYEFSSASDGSSESVREEYANIFVPYLEAGDVNGDGIGDLLSPRGSVGYASSSSREGSEPGPITASSSATFTGSSDLQFIDGSSGASLRSVSETDQPSFLSGVPIDDVDGDGINDVLTTRTTLPQGSSSCTIVIVELNCTEEMTPGSAQVAVLGGADLASLWTADFATPAVFTQAPADLSGDDAVDVVVAQYSFDAETPVEDGLVALDGSTGAELWARPNQQAAESGGFAFTDIVAVTPLQDDGHADLIVLDGSFNYDPETGEESSSASLVRLDGATGETLLTTTPFADDPSAMSLGLSASPADADGDGSDDVVLSGYSFDEDTGAERTRHVVESGRTGDQLSLVDQDHSTSLSVLGDIDGDGRDEGVLLDNSEFLIMGFGITISSYSQASSGSASGGAVSGEPGEPEEQPIPRMAVIGLDDGAELWATNAPIGITSLRAAGDLDGLDDGVDLVQESLVAFGDSAQSLTAARAGSDGHVLWAIPDPIAVRRVAGGNRIASAVALSADVHAAADTVIVARADTWPDAITGGPLAAVLDASLLLSAFDRLSPETAAEIQRLGAQRAILLGGESALSEQVAGDLRALGLTVERIGGTDRFTTAGNVARRIQAEGGDISHVSLVRGTHPDPEQGWVDAASAAAYGAAAGNPVLLTDPAALPPQTAAVIGELGVTDALVLGGPGAVSVNVEQAARDAGAHTLRVAGFDRYSTSRAAAQLAVNAGVEPSTVYVATGLRFPDALGASAATGEGGVLLLTNGSPGDEALELLAFIAANRDEIDEVVLIGGDAAIANSLEAKLRSLLG